MKTAIAIILAFAAIVSLVVYGTKEAVKDQKPKFVSRIPLNTPAPKVIERVKVIERIKVVEVPVTTIHEKETVERVVYVPEKTIAKEIHHEPAPTFAPAPQPVTCPAPQPAIAPAPQTTIIPALQPPPRPAYIHPLSQKTVSSAVCIKRIYLGKQPSSSTITGPHARISGGIKNGTDNLYHRFKRRNIYFGLDSVPERRPGTSF